jgi:hypothetical protein
VSHFDLMTQLIARLRTAQAERDRYREGTTGAAFEAGRIQGLDYAITQIRRRDVQGGR